MNTNVKLMLTVMYDLTLVSTVKPSWPPLQKWNIVYKWH